MTPITKKLFVTASAITLAAGILWQATGGDYYTKYEVIEQVPRTVDPDDPFAEAGLYEGGSQMETVRRDEFRFGLLPTPQGVFDKHAVSVVSFVVPAWIGTLGVALWTRRKAKRRTNR